MRINIEEYHYFEPLLKTINNLPPYSFELNFTIDGINYLYDHVVKSRTLHNHEYIKNSIYIQGAGFIDRLFGNYDYIFCLTQWFGCSYSNTIDFELEPRYCTQSFLTQVMSRLKNYIDDYNTECVKVDTRRQACIKRMALV